MKKYIYFLTCVFSLTFASCDESVLDINNENTISTGNFWKTEADIESGVVSVYNMFYRQGTWTRNIYTQMHGMADDGVSLAGWTELNEYSKFIYTNYNFGEVNTKIWKEHYVAIFRANQVLDNVDKVTFTSESRKADLVGQTKFLRSFYYFYLTALWDNLPFVLKTSSASDMPAQKTPDEIFTQLEEDLKDAVAKLPATRTAADQGRATKGAAYALLAKVYMQHHKWEEAIKCFEWLVDGEGKNYYDLMPDYGDNFRNTTENNKESLFEIQFSLINNVGFDQTDNYRDPNAQMGSQIEMNQAPAGIGWNNVEARRWLVDYYKREKTVEGKNDIRLFYSVWYNDSAKDFPERADSLIYGNKWRAEWGNRVFIKKYSTPANPLFYWNDNNFRSLRYSDMLLLYAEALNEVSGPTAKAIGYLNRVRQRAKLPALESSSYYNGAQIASNKNTFRDHLKIERGLELSLECVRWIDLKRWGLNDQASIDQLKVRDSDFNNFIVGKSHSMPIPQSEVDNNPNLKQNPNY
ncbi:RagB/SusD family nutrient uptake outer membrane protein [Emticicia sp. CRIBPO]|uniref:RagB/SusD family nutrient uptake outer membrane protein n=1 Tax=Emticicia sp. CRIBPO TaxID=2683258 RepID=UPI001412D14A|nr:RagB/SusD family nutrient uptake outer membrane protein [Emticicia sp. CRIBPO]NBA88465.1 RagB/SusD family nutrient uptake outer membrane protein [Emticicia sp. CRIBPO]